MKHTTYFNFSALLFCFYSFALPAYSQITNDIFEKKWKLVIDIQQRIAKMPEDERKSYEKLTPDQKKRIEADLVSEVEKSVISFNANNSFYVEFEGKRNYEGSWRVADDGRSVILQTKEGVQEQIVIKKIEPQKVVVANALRKDSPDIFLVPTSK